MKPELKKAMLESVDLDKLASMVPTEVVQAIMGHGLHKVAAELVGLPEVTDVTASMYIGRKLASRLAERRAVNAGIAALSRFQKTSASAGTWFFGDPVGDYFRNKDHDLRAARQYVAAGEKVPAHLAKNKYVAKHLAKDARKAAKKEERAARREGK